MCKASTQTLATHFSPPYRCPEGSTMTEHDPHPHLHRNRYSPSQFRLPPTLTAATATPHLPPCLIVETPVRTVLKGCRASVGGSKGGGRAGNKVLRRLRKSNDGERESVRFGSTKVKVSKALGGGSARAPSADGQVPALRATRRDERDILVRKCAM